MYRFFNLASNSTCRDSMVVSAPLSIVLTYPINNKLETITQDDNATHILTNQSMNTVI